MKDVVSIAAIVIAVLVLLGLLAFVVFFKKRQPKKIDPEWYETKWKELQGHLKDKSTWPLAIIDADKLLDEALKTRRFKGKTMGERLVAAQHELAHNTEVWFAHKLRNKLVHEQDIKLKQRDVKDALLGIRAALKDLGAL